MHTRTTVEKKVLEEIENEETFECKHGLTVDGLIKAEHLPYGRGVPLCLSDSNYIVRDIPLPPIDVQDTIINPFDILGLNLKFFRYANGLEDIGYTAEGDVEFLAHAGEFNKNVLPVYLLELLKKYGRFLDYLCMDLPHDSPAKQLWERMNKPTRPTEPLNNQRLNI